MSVNVANKGTLDALHTGGGIMNLVGDVKTKNGDMIHVVAYEEGATIFKKNPDHTEYAKGYIDTANYHDEIIGERYYWGHEWGLQVPIVEYSLGTVIATPQMLEVFDTDVVESLLGIVKNFNSIFDF